MTVNIVTKGSLTISRKIGCSAAIAVTGALFRRYFNVIRYQEVLIKHITLIRFVFLIVSNEDMPLYFCIVLLEIDAILS